MATVPGVSGDGITDPAAVATHHDQTLGTQYTVWADLYWRPANATGPGTLDAMGRHSPL